MPSTRRSEARWDEKMKRWHIKVQREGDRRSFYSSTKGRAGKHEAEALADEWLESNTAADVTLKEAWNAFLQTKKPPLRKKECYIKAESQGRVWIFPTIGENKRLSRLRPEHWQKVLDAMVKEGKGKNKNSGTTAQRTIVNMRAAITGFCKWARYVKHWPVEIPMMLSIPTTAPRPKKIKILQPDALRILFSVDTELWRGKRRPAKYIHAFRFAVLEGARHGELCGLQWGDICGNEWQISTTINRFNERSTTKTETSERIVPLHKRSIEELKAQKAISGDSPWVFPGEHGPMDYNSFYKAWKRYGRSNGIDISLHKLRHTFISYAKSDVPEALLKQMVGHTVDMDTYGVYGHDVDGDRARTADILDHVFDDLLSDPKSDPV